MSTRCQIGTYKNAKQAISKPTCLLYRHCDGYPKGIMPDIMPFLKKFKERRGLGDEEYLPAWLLYHLISLHVTMMADMHKDQDYGEKDGMDMLSHGICADKMFHGDIEYFYRINAEEAEVIVYECGYVDAPEKWTVVDTVSVDDFGKHPWFENGKEK